MTDFAQMRATVAQGVGGWPLDEPRTHQVNQAIRMAILQVRHRQFPWNYEDLSITLVTDQAEYAPGATANDLPTDFLYLVEKMLFLEDVDNSSSWLIEPLTSHELEVAKTQSDVSGTPAGWTLRGQNLILHPAPDDSRTWRVYGHYIKDLGAPEATQASGVFSWSADNFTSAWFDLDAGFDFVAATACAIYAQTYLKNSETAAQWSDMANQLLAGQVIVEERKRGVGVIRPWF